MKAKLGKKNCGVGASCKGTCISKDKDCIASLDKAQKTKVSKAVRRLLTSAANPKRTFIPKPEGKLIGEGANGEVRALNAAVLVKTGTSFYSPKTMAREAKLQNIASKLGVAPPVISYSDKSIKMRMAKGVLVEDFVATTKDNYPRRSPIAINKIDEMVKARDVALVALHKKGISHNDAHDQNAFWDADSKKFTFIDFGLATKGKWAAVLYEHNSEMSYTNKKFESVKELKAWLKTQ